MWRQYGSVTDFLLQARERDAVALWTLDRKYSYEELSTATTNVARYLLMLPVCRGDRVLLASENSLFWVAVYLGVLRAGLVCVPLAVGSSQQDLDYIREVTEAKVAFAESGFARRNRGCFRGCHVVTNLEIPALPGCASQKAFPDLSCHAEATTQTLPDVHADDLAALMFTSGSTGRPRGVMISHANIMANTESIIQYLGLTSADRIMTVLPFHYCFGTSLLHTHLRVGGSLVLDQRFMYPEVVLQRMIDTECTGLAGVPSHFQILLRRSSLRTKSFPHLRYVQQAGGHLAPAFIRELRSALPETDVFTMYGQTEATARLSYLPPSLLDQKSGSIGKGIPGVTLSVINESGHDVRPGEVGEIVAQGENIAAGYWRSPLESRLSFRDGRLYTGDQAMLDEDGYIYVVGRSKDFLKCGGKRVSCRSIEDLVLACDDVVEAAVIGIQDEVLGEASKLFIVPRDMDCQQLEQHLRLFCRVSLPSEFVPKEIVVLRSLPKNGAGKVMKEALKKEPYLGAERTAHAAPGTELASDREQP